MTNRERFLRTLNFQPVDRLPIIEWASWWDMTVNNWQREGLVIEDMPPLTQGEALQCQMGLDLNMQMWVRFTTGETPVPAYHGAPIVQTMDDYERILPTLYPKNTVNRERLQAMARYQCTGEGITWITVEGFFWGPRVLLGIEPHLFAFYDEPELMHRINEDIVNFNIHVFEQIFDVFTPDFMTFAEDMSYNNGPMISESLFNEFMLPYYQKMIPMLKERGVRIIVDSDGDISKALPWFLNAGIEGILPLERQAGVDLLKLRESYPKALFMGHFDKMCMPHGEEAMRQEFERLLPVMRQGGFIPSVDHQTPPGVTLEQYKTYLRLFREYAPM